MKGCSCNLWRQVSWGREDYYYHFLVGIYHEPSCLFNSQWNERERVDRQSNLEFRGTGPGWRSTFESSHSAVVLKVVDKYNLW